MNERNNLETEIDELKDERLELEEKRRQRTQINDQLDRINDEIKQRESRIDNLKNQRSNLTAQVERLEAEAQELRSDADQDSELLSLHKEANRLEVEIERLEESLDEIETEITRIEDRVAEQEDLQAQREHLQSNIEDLRTRVNRLEEGAVEQFNDHMEALLDILDYENLERIWIERTEQQVRQGRQTITQGRFELHIVRSTDDGTVYEDTVNHLSESEREVTGLVFALAGYLVHEVHEEVPFMLLDSIEAIDAPRIAELVDYLEQYTDYLVVALLEEDAQALADDYQRIRDI
jgi:chromosome segregation ATPase